MSEYLLIETAAFIKIDKGNIAIGYNYIGYFET